MIKVFFLSDINNPHTIRWIQALTPFVEIMLFSLSAPITNWFESEKNLHITYLPLAASISETSTLNKLRYLKALKYIKYIVLQFKPDIIHAHYASSYGLLSTFIHKIPTVLSVWGSDVFEFPKISIFHKLLLQYIFKKSDKILSSSFIMAEEISQYTDKHIDVIPFGIDIELFSNKHTKENNIFTIGIAKSLKKIYGIDLLIYATSTLIHNNPNKTIHLLIAGEGPQEDYLKHLVSSLGITLNVTFLGRLSNDEMPNFYNQLDISVFPSHSESFGVSAIESMACECPVVTSNAPGFKEVVTDGGFVVTIDNIERIVEKVQLLIDSPTLLKDLAKKGRQLVLEKYNLQNCIDKQYKIYKTLLL